MTITITPGHRDEELIAKIKEAKRTLTEEEWQHICYEAIDRNDEKWLDALYYAAEEREDILACWQKFLHEELTHFHMCGFVSDLGGLRGEEYWGKY